AARTSLLIGLITGHRQAVIHPARHARRDVLRGGQILARRLGGGLAAAGEWRLAAILTDLAWLLRAYSQSVSSDGAQHGEKTS
ncbi:hypothetical protein, partial [Pseudomonas aeruginosa]|uniref:hypothetical protein n=1 Tax=Pseudomonas aeruginosa TaxID=287 RepID=UPI0027D87D6A